MTLISTLLRPFAQHAVPPGCVNEVSFARLTVQTLHFLNAVTCSHLLPHNEFHQAVMFIWIHLNCRHDIMLFTSHRRMTRFSCYGYTKIMSSFMLKLKRMSILSCLDSLYIYIYIFFFLQWIIYLPQRKLQLPVFS